MSDADRSGGGTALRHRLEHAAYRAAAGVLRGRSHQAARPFGRRLGAVAWALSRRRRRLAVDNLAAALPERSRDELRRLARASFQHFGANACEVVSAERFTAGELAERFEVDGWEHLDRAAAAQRGLLLLTGHYGPAELAAVPVALRLGGVHLVYRPPNNPRVAAELERARSRAGIRLIGKRGAAVRMLGALRRGGCVGVQIDQRVRREQGVEVPFFGRPAWTSTVPASLSLLTGAPAVPMFCEPAAPGRYRLRIDPPIDPPPVVGRGPWPELEADLTARYLASLEAQVRRRPELWLWLHRRWGG